METIVKEATNITEGAVEAITIEDLRELLATKGLDIKELAQEAKAMKNEANLEKQITAPKKKVVTKDPVFELALANYPDFVIRKSTVKTEKLLVIMPSQNSYYIKTVKNGTENKEVLDRKSYGAFTSGMQIIILEDFWIDCVRPGVAFYDNIMRLLEQEPIRQAIMGRYYIKHRTLRYNEAEMYAAIPNILKAFPGQDLYPGWQDLKTICDKFGLENTKALIAESEHSLAKNIFSSSNFDKKLLEYDFKFSSFKDYLLYDSVRMGYADTIYHMLYEWEDTLNMQVKLYGKVKEKYPKHLSEMHNQLAYKMRLMKEEINERNFAKRSAETAKFEATISGYMFIAPKKPQDFYDEATMQSNCLAGYVDKYTDGKDYIIFMRKKDTPETSLVTIELNLDGKLRQAYQARNSKVTVDQEKAINTWLETVVQKVIKEK